METLRDLATNPAHTRWMYPALLVADAILCGLIIQYVPCKCFRAGCPVPHITCTLLTTRDHADTEIDWKAYMEQIAIYNKGERDYKRIEGGTGPLVYPGAHVLIYRVLYWLTDKGTNIQAAQYIFAMVYLSTLAVVLQCYRNAKVPPYVFPLLILSKRLHSIFMLRCFNDCFAVLGLFAAIYCYQTKRWHLGSFFYTTGLNVKMSLLLPLPAMGFLFLQALGSTEATTQAMIIVQVTVCSTDSRR